MKQETIMVKPASFKALVVEECTDGTFTRTVRERTFKDLPHGEVTIQVMYSSLNYKDALSATGNKGVTKVYPHTPGIDAAGIVEESHNNAFEPGEQVIVTGFDLGMNTPGGFGQYIRVPAAWVLKLPTNLTLQESMIYGTAGFTAGLCVDAITKLRNPEDGDILVTGASGGVGCISVAILAKLGFSVVAISGKPEAKGFLLQLGAKQIIDRQEATDTSGRTLLKSRWAGVIDAVGGDILATAIRATQLHGIVASCGNVASQDLPLNIFPFILRGITLKGVTSQNAPMKQRLAIWKKLSEEWKIDRLVNIHSEVSLEQLSDAINLILEGKLMGRTVVAL